MSNSIKIDADLSGFRKSMMDLQKDLNKGLGKAKIELFSKEQMSFIKELTDERINDLQKGISKAKTDAQEYANAAKKAAKGSEEEAKFRKMALNSMREAAKLTKEQEELKGPGKKGFGAAISKGLGKIPGLGSITSVLGAGGTMGLMAGSLGVAAGAYGVSRLSAGFDRFSGGVDDRVKLMGKGAGRFTTDMNPNLIGGFKSIGMNQEAMNSARLASMDIFGAKGSNQTDILQRGKFARNFGLDVNEMQGLGGGFRQQMGVQGANRDFVKLLSSSIASGLEDSQIGNYLQVASESLVSIREEGFASSSQVLGALSALTKVSNSPETAARDLKGLDSSVRNSSGEANAFLQMAFTRGGIGGGTLGGVQAAIKSGGIFGIDEKDLKGMDPAHLKMLNKAGVLGGGAQERIGAITNQLDSTFGANPKSPEALLAKGRFASNALGIQNPVKAIQLLDQFKNSVGKPDEMKKVMADIQKESLPTDQKQLKNLEDISKSVEGSYQETKALKEINETAMGQAVAPAVIKMQGLLTSIDKLILGIYNGLARIIPGMESTQQILEGGLSGKGALSEGDLRGVANAEGASKVTTMAGQMGAQEYDLKQELQNYQDQKKRNGVDNYADAMIKVISQKLDNLHKSQEAAITVLSESHKFHQMTAQSTKQMVTETKKPKAQLPAKGAPTGK